MEDKNTKISHFLLLIGLGVIIYFLFQKDFFTNKESFTDQNHIYVSNDTTSEQQEIEIPKLPPIQQPTMQPVLQPLTTIKNIVNKILDKPETQVQPELTDIIFSPTNIDSTLFNFTPNDDSINDFEGVNLNDAFNLPLPQGTNVDAVDFKKGNMDNYNAKDFLPKEINDEWFETDFSLAKYQLNDDKLINTERYIIGINTVGQSLKNASYDIRGTIPNPKFAVSPWMNSTYEPDFNLKPLC